MKRQPQEEKPRTKAPVPTRSGTMGITRAPGSVLGQKSPPRGPPTPNAAACDEAERLRAENDSLLAALRSLQAKCASVESGSQAPGAPAALEPAKEDDVYTIVVFGASGDLAKKKIYPSLFGLRVNGWLPTRLAVVGFARTSMTDDEFRNKIISAKDHARCPEFVEANHYVAGQYDSLDDAKRLSAEISKLEEKMGVSKERRAHRIFYMAVPPSVFVGAARAIHGGAKSCGGWTRVVVEKPFGMDLESSRAMIRDLGALFREEEIYRIDHYLGKEMVQNLNILRFANTWLTPLWNREHITSVLVTFKEDIGTEGRAGYFDSFGIIRDIMQNHLLQILSLLAMEAPVTLNEEDVRDEKVKVLRAIPPLSTRDVVIGQFAGYLDEPDVPKDSVTPTYAAARIFVNNPRWAGVPFVLRCGKALNERKAEIRVQFRSPVNFLYPGALPNELVIRVQPNEAVYLKMLSKAPGMSQELVQTELDLSIKTRFDVKESPDAYEHLIRDVFRGDHSLFVRSDELDAAWRIFTPLLHDLEQNRVKPLVYEKGSRGPSEGDRLLREEGGYRYTSRSYSWPVSNHSPSIDPSTAAVSPPNQPL